jgi:hypothetical protein
MHAHGFLAIQRHHSPRVHSQSTTINNKNVVKTLNEVESKNHSYVISGFLREVDDISAALLWGKPYRHLGNVGKKLPLYAALYPTGGQISRINLVRRGDKAGISSTWWRQTQH